MENWVIKNKKADFASLVQGCGISEVLVRCLVNKGYDTAELMNEYLHSNIHKIHNPFLMKDMKKACDILAEKIKLGKKIRIIGDYDVDGVISTYVLYRGFVDMGANIDYEIPDRIKDGYGINIQMVEAAYEAGVDTILTCDNGIVAMEQTLLAKQYGMTVIITDHHSLLETEDGFQIPAADAVVNVHQPDCPYPFKELCGGAVAYQLVVAMMDYYPREQKAQYMEELLSYVAIATVCDVMTLVEENRVIVTCGLERLKRTRNLGLLALMAECGIEPDQLAAFHLGFIIGPCLNASGRLDTAKKGIRLLLAEDREEANKIALEVKELNDLRKEMTTKNVEKAVQLINSSEWKEDKVLVVYLEDCHESIAGIIAGRIREKFNRPTIVLTDAHECVKGSARSIEQYNMIEELSKVRGMLRKVGGHPMAAGLSLDYDQVDALRKQLNENTVLTEEDLVPKVTIDLQMSLGYVTESLVNELRQLEPFGKGNEKPLFVEKNLRIKSLFVIGKNSSGIRFRLEDRYKKELDALYFGDVEGFFAYIGKQYGEEAVKQLKTGRGTGIELAVTYFPKINEYNGFKNLQLLIQNYR